MTPARWLLSAAKGTPRIFARTHRERTRVGNRSQGLSTYTAVHGCPSRPGAAARESATRYSVKSSDRRADGESREPQLATSKECVDRSWCRPLQIERQVVVLKIKLPHLQATCRDSVQRWPMGTAIEAYLHAQVLMLTGQDAPRGLRNC